LAGAASLQRENNNSSELGFGKKYNRDADPTEWLTGSLGKPGEGKRQSKLDNYQDDPELMRPLLNNAQSTRKLDGSEGHN
jgi:hypothetical protein